MKRLTFPLVFLLLVFIPIVASPQETLTITTYYPAPFGVYTNMRLFPSAQPACAVANDEGVLYFDSGTHELMVCKGDGAGHFSWQNAGGLWTLAENAAGTKYVRPNDINWSVGIGTTQPDAKLDVRGGGLKVANSNFIIPVTLYTSSSDEPADFDEEFVVSLQGHDNNGVMQTGDDRSSIFIGPSSAGATAPAGRLELSAKKIYMAASGTGGTGSVAIGWPHDHLISRPLDVNGGAVFRGNHLYIQNPASTTNVGGLPGHGQAWGLVVNTVQGYLAIGPVSSNVYDVPGTGGGLATSIVTIKPEAPANSISIDSAGKVHVPFGTAADYVFEPGYKLLPLEEVAEYTQKFRRLPRMGKTEGNDGSINDLLTKQTEKIEELTLYLIKQNEKIKALERKIEGFEARKE